MHSNLIILSKYIVSTDNGIQTDRIERSPFSDLGGYETWKPLKKSVKFYRNLVTGHM